MRASWLHLSANIDWCCPPLSRRWSRRSDTLSGMPRPALDFNLSCPPHDVLLTASAGFHQAQTAEPSQFFVCFVCTRFWNYIEHISVRLPWVYVLGGFDSASALSNSWNFQMLFSAAEVWWTLLLFLFVPFAQKLSGKGNPLLWWGNWMHPEGEIPQWCMGHLSCLDCTNTLHPQHSHQRLSWKQRFVQHWSCVKRA